MLGISVIVPTFKRVEQTIKTLQLVLASEGVSTSFLLEIIVSDNTPDTSLKDAVLSLDSRIRHVRPEKNSIAASKNAGAKAATYPVIIFCDSDIEVEPQTLLETVHGLQKHSHAAMITGTTIWRGKSDVDGNVDRPRAEDRMLTVGESMYIESIYSRFVGTYKELFLSVGGYNEDIFGMRGEGSDLSIRYWRAGFPLVYEEKIIVHHIYDAEESAAIRVPHPKWGIAKDLLLLGMRYDCFDGSAKNFEKTVQANFSDCENPAMEVLGGIAKYSDFIAASLPQLKEGIQAVYPFRFLEVFSDEELVKTCVHEAETKLHAARSIFSS